MKCSGTLVCRNGLPACYDHLFNLDAHNEHEMHFQMHAQHQLNRGERNQKVRSFTKHKNCIGEHGIAV
jgi:hypothetical protein